MLRAGSKALSIFANALNARVIRAHVDGPLRPAELEEAFGWAPQSSLRAVVNNMCELGALARVGSEPGASGAATELTVAGRDLLPVADGLERWLACAPGGPIPLDDTAAHGTARILSAGWDSTVVRAVAERPQTLIELSAEIPSVNYPALKRRLAKLRATQLVVPVTTDDSSAYIASDWLRQAVAPLVLAGRWELRHDTDAEPVSQVEVEAAFLLTLPRIQLPSRVTGTFALAVLISEAGVQSKPDVAGITVKLKGGELVSCHTGATPTHATWALGSVDAWFDAVIDGAYDKIRFGGEKSRFAQEILKAIHAGLFGS